MNTGADKATGDVLLFLHADTRPPADVNEVLGRFYQSAKEWGRFNVSFDSSSVSLKVVAFFINLRSRLSGIATGDQAIFVKRDAFAAVNGFDPLPLMEDVAMSRKLKRLSRPWCCKRPVITSARRWEQNGVIRTVLLMWAFRLAYFLGVSPEVLARRYRQIR